MSLTERLNDHNDEYVVQAPIGIANETETARQQVQDLVDQVVGDRPDEAEEIDFENFNCQVCWEKYNTGTRKPVVISCGHPICLSCLRQLQSLKCPKCVRQIRHVIRLFV